MNTTSKKKKNSRPYILMFVFALLALLILLYVFLIPKLQPPADDSTTGTDQISLAAFDAKTTTGITYTRSGVTLSFVCDDGVWYYSDDRDLPVSQDLLGKMNSAISAIMAERKLDSGDVSVSDSGLDNPAYKITVSYSTGTTVTYLIGNLNSFNSNYYFSIDGDDSIYMIASGLVPYFDYALLDLVVYDTIPTLTVDQISSYDIVSTLTTVNVTDADLISQLTSLYFYECVDFKPGNDALASYGLDSGATRIVAHYTVTKTVAADESTPISSTAGVSVNYDMTFKIGNKFKTDGGQEYYYVMFNDSPMVYTMSAAPFDLLLQKQ